MIRKPKAKPAGIKLSSVVKEDENKKQTTLKKEVKNNG